MRFGIELLCYLRGAANDRAVPVVEAPPGAAASRSASTPGAAAIRFRASLIFDLDVQQNNDILFKLSV
jgi:hypothetical protein